jgi:hypothetical protein
VRQRIVALYGRRVRAGNPQIYRLRKPVQTRLAPQRLRVLKIGVADVL